MTEQFHDGLEARKEKLRDYTIAGPPKLRLRLVKRIQFLLLANIIPILVGLWLAWGYSQGTIKFAEFDHFQFLATVVILILSCAILMATTWFVLPVARWMRDYPYWHFKRRSQVLWVLPTVIGWAIWFTAWIGTAVCGMVAFGLLVVGLFELFQIGSASGPEKVTEPTSSSVPLE